MERMLRNEIDSYELDKRSGDRTAPTCGEHGHHAPSLIG
jgi:hypothetical protein